MVTSVTRFRTPAALWRMDASFQGHPALVDPVAAWGHGCMQLMTHLIKIGSVKVMN